MIFARPLVTIYAEHFADVPGKLELTIRLARIMLPFLTLVALAAAAMGMLNSLRHYFLPALAPATFNVVAIVLALLLTPVMPAFGLPRVMSLAIAALVGGVDADRGAVAAAAARRISLPAHARSVGPRSASGAAADGTRHDWTRRHADQPVRQHAYSRPVRAPARSRGSSTRFA